jgi:hypothetical protein
MEIQGLNHYQQNANPIKLWIFPEILQPSPSQELSGHLVIPIDVISPRFPGERFKRVWCADIPVFSGPFCSRLKKDGGRSQSCCHFLLFLN